MNSEEHDDLWDLLGKAREPQVSPFFSRNVLRAIRKEEPAKRNFLAWLRRHWQVAAFGVGVVVIAAAASIRPVDQPDQIALLAYEVSTSPDYQVITHLDELMDSEQSSVWLENVAY